MTRKELLEIAARVRDMYGPRAEEFALSMIRHFDGNKNRAAKVWRSVHEFLAHVPVQSLTEDGFDYRQAAQAQHLDREAC